MGLASKGPDLPGRLPYDLRFFDGELRKRHFLQLWCDDTGLRRRALIERALAMTSASDISRTADLRRRVTFLAQQLEIPEPSLADLREYGHKHRMHAAIARLDALR